MESIVLKRWKYSINRRTSRGKGKSKAHPTFASEIYSDNQDEIENISDDWDEEAMDEAFKRSMWVWHAFIQINNDAFVFRHDDKGNTRTAGSSKVEKDNEDLSDDPFVNIPSKNVMPTPPSRAKKVYLEDFENFTVKWETAIFRHLLRRFSMNTSRALPNGDESLFDQVQDPLLRRQYRGLPALRYKFHTKINDLDNTHSPLFFFSFFCLLLGGPQP